MECVDSERVGSQEIAQALRDGGACLTQEDKNQTLWSVCGSELSGGTYVDQQHAANPFCLQHTATAPRTAAREYAECAPMRVS